MLFAIGLIVIATAGGAALTYWYDRAAPLAARLCMGCCTGLAALGLVGFFCSLLLGLTPLTLLLSAAVLAAPLALLTKPSFKTQVQADVSATAQQLRRAVLHPKMSAVAYLLFYVLVALMLYSFFDRAVVEQADGIYTGGSNNLGDLPFHFASITSFVYGHNFPPEDPSFAGTSFAYPFIADFVAAMLMRAGTSLRDSMLLHNMVLALSLVGVLHHWTLKLSRNRLAGFLAPVLVLFSGGLGWVMLLREARAGEKGIFQMLWDLQHDYTILPGQAWRWGNSLTTLFITQRSILFGLPIAITIFTQWWLALNPEKVKVEEARKKERAKAPANPWNEEPPRSFLYLFPARPFSTAARRMIAAGVMAGMLLLVHAHTFIMVMGMAGCLALIFFKESWREWAAFFALALLFSVPQMLWVMTGSSVEAKSFIGWHFGWDKAPEANFAVFWLKNTGLFIPLLVAALLWRTSDYLIARRWLVFYLPFTLCFIGPNLVKLAPWPWDNIKVLFYWYVASVPIVAYALARLWEGKWFLKAAMAVVLLTLTAAGALDVWRVASKQIAYQEYETDGVRLAEKIVAQTPPRALILHAPTYNPVVFLTGRRSLLGYTGYIWAHGLDFEPRERDIRNIYTGAYNARELLMKNNVDYVVVTPVERNYMPVNDAFFAQYPLVAEVGAYRLYQVRQP
ncbi:MAG: hypothetical protein JO360_08260 [Acidobacteria bacterium]|nr:hypothetical protein [Acidobacteriota bacterium]